MKDYKFGTMIRFEQGGSCCIIDCESNRARKLMQSAVDDIVSSPQFRGAEICRNRFERAKLLSQYGQCRALAQHAETMYRICRGRIKTLYLESLTTDHEHTYIDITPFGVLLDEISYAIQSLQNYV